MSIQYDNSFCVITNTKMARAANDVEKLLVNSKEPTYQNEILNMCHYSFPRGRRALSILKDEELITIERNNDIIRLVGLKLQNAIGDNLSFERVICLSGILLINMNAFRLVFVENISNRAYI